MGGVRGWGVFFFKQKTAYEISACLVGSEMCIRDSIRAARSIDIFLRPFKGTEGRDALIAHIRALRADETAAIAPKLAAVRAPTAVLWGRHDRVTNLSIGKRLQASIPAATLSVIDDGGHFTPEEAPRQVADGIAALLRR